MSDDPLRDEANRAAHRGMRVLANVLEDDHYEGDIILTTYPELVAVAAQYQDLQRRQQGNLEAYHERA